MRRRSTNSGLLYEEGSSNLLLQIGLELSLNKSIMCLFKRRNERKYLHIKISEQSLQTHVTSGTQSQILGIMACHLRWGKHIIKTKYGSKTSKYL